MSIKITRLFSECKYISHKNFQGNRLSHVGAISIFGKHAACLRKDACNTGVFVLLYSKLKSGLGESSQFYFRRCTMGVWQIILGIVLILFSVAIIVVVLLQEGHQAGLGAQAVRIHSLRRTRPAQLTRSLPGGQRCLQLDSLSLSSV